VLGPVWMGVEKRKSFAHTGFEPSVAVPSSCQNERYKRARACAHTHTHTHIYFFLGSVQESQAERSCLSPIMGHKRTKGNLKSGLINPYPANVENIVSS
jgi:hypothetical protein